MRFTVRLTRKRTYIEDGVVDVEAKTVEEASKFAIQMVIQGDVEFHADAGETDVVDLRVATISTSK